MTIQQAIRLALAAGLIGCLAAGCSDDSDSSKPVLPIQGGAGGDDGFGGEGGDFGAGNEGEGGAGGGTGQGRRDDCPQGLISCGPSFSDCVDPRVDPEHCGECGAACDAGFVCSDGSCELSCQSGLVECDGYCINPLKSLDYCGARPGCDDAESCPSGDVCSLGSCARSCQAGLIECDGTCIDPERDPVYCGARGDCSGRGSGTACTIGSICIDGTCRLSCDAEQIACDAKCVSPLQDLKYCGATYGCGDGQGVDGEECDDGEVCSNGACALSCHEALVECNGLCVNPWSDRNYCGATAGCGVNGVGSAGAVCGPGDVCTHGVCSRSCPAGTVKCDSSCFDPLKDRLHCGATFGCGANEGGSAGAVCGDARVCSSGSCLLSCQIGLVQCAGTCINPDTDRMYCGATEGCGADGGDAGEICDPGYVCNKGACSLSCADGLVNCRGFCTDPMEDRMFCGATEGCGTHGQGDDGEVCAAGYVCNEGVCSLSCPLGLVNCNGACVDPMQNRGFCGATPGCGQDGGNAGDVCEPGYVCSEGECSLSCAAGLVECGGNCVDPDVDRTHCGATEGCGDGSGSAGQVCQPGFVCNEGSCDRSCHAGLVNCDSACIDPDVDRRHCGATVGCGIDGQGDAGEACEAGYVCNQGSCSLSCPNGLVNCGGVCIDPNQDRAHCGASGRCGDGGGSAGDQCDPGEVCNAGSCALSCAGALVNCGGTCIDPSYDRRNCGATVGCGVNGGSAGERCDPGEVCNAGLCTLSCPVGFVNCRATCIDPQIDRDFCGATSGCGNAGVGSAGDDCDRGEVCSAGQCALSCQGNRIDCGGRCIDPDTDRVHCGATDGCGESGGGSGAVCLAGQVCAAGACDVSCPGGLVNCNDVCVDPETSQAHCGATEGCDVVLDTAGESCAAGYVCIGGVCEVSCPSGLVECEDACIDPDTNRQFCGATPGCGDGESSAGAVCPDGFACVSGECSLTCPSGLVNCNSTCIDPSSNPDFCGASGECTGSNAGVDCGSAFACVAGECRALQPQ